MLDRIIYRPMKCQKCQKPTTFCYELDSKRQKHYRIWCADCYRLFKVRVSNIMIKNYSLLVANLPRYEPIVSRRPDKSRRLNPDVVKQGEQPVEEIRRLQSLDYKTEYLKTEHWKQVRAMALANAGNRCQLCNNDRSLQVHHRTYERVGHEDLKDLTVLCGRCHRAFHGK